MNDEWWPSSFQLPPCRTATRQVRLTFCCSMSASRPGKSIPDGCIQISRRVDGCKFQRATCSRRWLPRQPRRSAACLPEQATARGRSRWDATRRTSVLPVRHTCSPRRRRSRWGGGLAANVRFQRGPRRREGDAIPEHVQSANRTYLFLHVASPPVPCVNPCYDSLRA